MKMKRISALILVIVMSFSLFAGCSDATQATDDAAADSATTADSGTADSGAADEGEASSDTPAADRELLTVEMFDVASNYQGVQAGWFAQVLKEKFNIELNIIAPQVAGDAVFQTRSSSGNLGDVLILEAIDFKDSIAAGLVKDITDDIATRSNLMEYKVQIDNFNQGLPDNDSGAIYGIPAQMTNTGATAYSQEEIYSSPLLRWDYYQELGSPEIADLNGLLDVLGQMMEAHPTNEAGDPAYPFSLWADWDGGDGMLGIANVVQLTTWYGEKIKGSVILKPDGTFIPLTDKAGTYYKMLKFLNDAYLRGLVDPDSGTQNWDSVSAKLKAGQIHLMWYSWMKGNWNTIETLGNGTAYQYVPVKDQVYYADADTYFGSGRVFGVGSGVEGEKYTRIMEFLDWYASPEGLMFEHVGLEGFNYAEGEDGRLVRMNDDAGMVNTPVPEEWGGGGYDDGNNKINQWIVESISTNPLTGEPYNPNYWSTYKEATMTQMKEEWSAMFGAANDVDYMKKNNILLVSPNVSVSLPSDTPDISVIRNQCNSTLCDYSWRMIFVEDAATFDAMWDELAAELDGFDFQQLVEFDTTKHQIELDAKNSVA
jgi:multiple sugar transport system substrate-binding protein/putative aldouronate transport system substrate-binding protein